ncbi:hypothetical protein NQ317_013896 [Molorchus minor]|uniref:Ebony n=1 Tax=Molorchus minor TaxID=1323400 RepID=A0ABQ9K7L1_9CUCU|nr:hypothetical protein NQ317_013896 [Molorchus minor]
MGTIPQLSVIKGSTRKLTPNILNRLFENVANGPAENHTALIFDVCGECGPHSVQYVHDDGLDGDAPKGGHIRQHSYRNLDRITNKLARAIAQLTVSYNMPRNADGDYIIAVNMHPTDHLIMVLLAIWKAGAAYLPLDHAFPGPRIDHIVREAKPVMVIYDEETASDSYLDTFKLSFEELVNQSNNQPEEALEGEERLSHVNDDLAIVLYTSGSTGIPKGVRIPHKVILNRLQWQFKRFPYSNTENVCIFKTALTFVDSISEIWGPLISGRCLLVVPKALTKDPEKLVTLMDEYKIERLVLVPSLLRSLLMFLELQVSPWTTRSSTYWIRTSRPVKAGDAGELYVSGLNLAAGYIPLRNYIAPGTSTHREGTLVYEGRTDSQVKIRGHRVDLTEVEKAVNSVDGVDKAVVLCYNPGEMNQALLAFVTTQSLISENQIEAILKDKLTSYMIPQVVLVENIPLLVNGKTDRQQLLKMYENTNNNVKATVRNADDSNPEVEISYEGVVARQMEAAKILFEIVASVLNRAARSAICVNANFYEIGGNSLNSIYTISRLSEKGYHIAIGDFISAMDLGEVLERMTSDTIDAKLNTQPPSFSSELLKNEYKNAVLDMITTSFYEKADLEHWIVQYISEADYKELVDALWEPLLDKNLSFIVKSETEKIVGVALNFDARDEPEVQIKSKLNVIFEFLESIEGPVRDMHLPQGKGKILHSFMMATHSSLSPKENVAAMQFMEDEVLNLARSRQFAGLFTTNTSPLTQQLGTDVHGYQTMLDYQVNKYVASDNTKPFGLAPDEQRALVQWKPII